MLDVLLLLALAMLEVGNTVEVVLNFFAVVTVIVVVLPLRVD
jgi:hypothetical protein